MERVVTLCILTAPSMFEPTSVSLNVIVDNGAVFNVINSDCPEISAKLMITIQSQSVVVAAIKPLPSSR